MSSNVARVQQPGSAAQCFFPHFSAANLTRPLALASLPPQGAPSPGDRGSSAAHASSARPRPGASARAPTGRGALYSGRPAFREAARPACVKILRFLDTCNAFGCGLVATAAGAAARCRPAATCGVDKIMQGAVASTDFSFRHQCTAQRWQQQRGQGAGSCIAAQSRSGDSAAVAHAALRLKPSARSTRPDKAIVNVVFLIASRAQTAPPSRSRSPRGRNAAIPRTALCLAPGRSRT